MGYEVPAGWATTLVGTKAHTVGIAANQSTMLVTMPTSKPKATITKARVGYGVTMEPGDDEGMGTYAWALTLWGARRLGERYVAQQLRVPNVVEVIQAPGPNDSYGYICRQGSMVE